MVWGFPFNQERGNMDALELNFRFPVYTGCLIEIDIRLGLNSTIIIENV